MMKRHVRKILRRHGLVPTFWSNRDIGYIKNQLVGDESWRSFLVMILMAGYFADTLPEEGIFVKELNCQFGGTLGIEAGRF